jgi:hypothetical protein
MYKDIKTVLGEDPGYPKPPVILYQEAIISVMV